MGTKYCVFVLGILLAVFVGCAHAPRNSREGESTVALDGTGTYGVRGQIIDAKTKIPIEGAVVRYTDIGSTHTGMHYSARGQKATVIEVARSDETGLIDADFQFGWGMNLVLKDIPQDATIGEQYEMAENVWLQVKTEHTFWIDVSKKGYCIWARVFKNTECSPDDGRLVIELGEVELVPVE